MCIRDRSRTQSVCLFVPYAGPVSTGSIWHVASLYPPDGHNGSKQSNHTATAVVLKSHIITKRLEHPITLQNLLTYHNLFTHSFHIIFCWLPSQVGILVNEKADKAAKYALNKPILRIPVPHTDFKPIIIKYIHDKWQQTWNSQN